MRAPPLLSVFAALALAACVSTASMPRLPSAEPGQGWRLDPASAREVGLGLPGGARLADDVAYAGGLEITSPADAPTHSLSDLKVLEGTRLVAVSDAGDLFSAGLILGREGRLVGLVQLQVRRLTLADGAPIADKADGDAEGLAVLDNGDLLVSFERNHRIWSYGSPSAPAARPVAVRRPDAAFAPNDGMEAISARDGGWRVAGESGGVWDCSPTACMVVTPVPDTPLPDNAYRITGMDRDPSGDGFFVVQRSYAPPIDARARVRRMAADGTLGPVLIELKLPGTTDNFEGIAAVARDGATRLYILSDDNNSDRQRTLLLAFDLAN